MFHMCSFKCTVAWRRNEKKKFWAWYINVTIIDKSLLMKHNFFLWITYNITWWHFHNYNLKSNDEIFSCFFYLNLHASYAFTDFHYEYWFPYLITNEISWLPMETSWFQRNFSSTNLSFFVRLIRKEPDESGINGQVL
jgi:hypothetical protein